MVKKSNYSQNKNNMTKPFNNFLVLDMFSQLALLLMLLLIAKGWAITRLEITNKLYVIIAICAVMLAYLVNKKKKLNKKIRK